MANMPYDLTENQIGSIFQDKGLIPMKINIVRNNMNQSKGFGYVQFDSEDKAQEAF